MIVSLELRTLSMASRDGAFASPEEEKQKAGQVRVWNDEKRSVLLMDSADPSKRRVQWSLTAEKAPGSVYVETIAPSIPGSLCLLSLDLDNAKRKGFNEGKPDLRAARDYVLVTPRNASARRDAGPSGEGLPGLPGFGNYAAFQREQRDGLHVWVLTDGAKN